MLQYPGQHSLSLRNDLVPLLGQALTVEDYQSRAGRKWQKEMGVMCSFVHPLIPLRTDEENLSLTVVLEFKIRRIEYNFDF